MPMAQSRIWSRPTAMKCSSGVSIQPYVASSAYQSSIGRQSPDCSACRLMSSQVSQNASISARVGVVTSFLLEGQRHRWAVLDGGLHVAPPGLVGVLVEHDHPIGGVVEAEDVRRLALAHLVPLAEAEVGAHPHRVPRLSSSGRPRAYRDIMSAASGSGPGTA